MKKNTFTQVIVLIAAAFIGFAGTLLSFRAVLGQPDYISVTPPSREQVQQKQRADKKNAPPKDEKKTVDNKTPEKVVPVDTPLSLLIKRKNLSLPLKNVKIIVAKSKRKLFVYSGNEILKSYNIGLGPKPNGFKVMLNDGKTPEGTYYINQKMENGLPARLGSRWIRISYPNYDDAVRGLKLKLVDEQTVRAVSEAMRKRGVPPQETKLGGGIGLHGGGPTPMKNFTRGCIGLTNKDISEIYPYIGIGTLVVIKP